ncbi:MAG: hypothetical protein JNK94_06065 [Hyphomonadaceae bacterium]|nr:hypothetical protein [Hyphomonadaceae bacterium]
MRARLWAGLGAAGFIALSALCSYPGMLNPDSASQLWQARHWSELHDWHPPIIAAIWAPLTAMFPSPADMFFLQTALFALGGYNLALALAPAAHAPRPRARLALMAAATLAFLPMALLAAGFISKDSLMAGCLFAAGALLCRAWRDARARTALSAAGAAALIALGLFSRVNAFMAAAPLAALWFIIYAPAVRGLVARRPWAGLTASGALGAVLAVLLLLATGPLNSLLGARDARAMDSLAIFDLAGITRFSGQNQFDRAPAFAGVFTTEAISACYEPQWWDVFRTCANVFPTVQAKGPAASGELRAAWREAIDANPGAYLRHRTGYFLRALHLRQYDSGWDFANDVLFTETRWVTNRDGGWADVTPQMREDVQVWRPHLLARALQAAARRSIEWGVQGPALWLLAVLAMGALALTRRTLVSTQRLYLPLLALTASGAANTLGLFFVGVADPSRYHMWTFFVCLMGALILIANPAAKAKA